ncbi:phospholipid-transporting ATPase IK [Ochotona princeps]|uniref:phospholipid-transporting ATPase IK n=1 Tax=Ochotona princeps TaxID=9978 RepID=UPI0027150EE5|nr:phospholipid-transporting ATPase IK [Ochotona princeps]
MGSLTYRDHQDDDKNTAFTWEVRANNRAFQRQAKEGGFFCWQNRKYKTNLIHTAKYNVLSFLPLNLYEQFHRMSNVYFLLIIILQTIPEISTLPWFTLFAPLVCLLLIRATRDLVDDIGRHRSDRTVNNRPCQILLGKGFLWKKWKNLCVGDVVCLSQDSIVPADLLLLASTEPSSLCYVETADIDGETNLKFRQAPSVTHHELTSVKKMSSFQGTVMCEAPNSRMHHFVGRLEWNGRKYPLDIGNLLLRGCKIRNTDTCYGLVIYAGFDTKIMKNCGKIHLKRTKLDLLMNKLVILIFLSLVVISLGLMVGFAVTFSEFREKHYYLPAARQSRGLVTESFFIFWGFVILLSVMVPMAMFIIAEFIYLGNSVFINWDQQMYYEEQDIPAKARSTSLNDHLGQVEYIFSDKTGTLTQNIMTFNKCCIAGRIYGAHPGVLGAENPYQWNQFAYGKFPFYNKELLGLVRTNKNQTVREFWRLLALCHTVMVHEKGSQLLYQAASPDEEALVTAARNFGYVFLSRTQDTITLVELGVERVYQVLAMMDFNSVRKRMSVLVRTPEGSICLYTKGADTVILERLRKRGPVEATTEEALFTFAQQTLRTLCLASKEVSEDELAEWQRRHQEASLLLQNRAQALHQVYNEMEQNLELLGVTAIEDKLQDGVPDTIKCLRKGNIRVWVLTGDKQETAVNIGFACQLLSENMLILEEKDINSILETYWENNNLHPRKKGLLRSLPQARMAMVVNGEFLDQLLLSLRKEPRALVQNVVVDEAWQEPGLGRRDFLNARRISMLWRNLGGQLNSPGQPREEDEQTQECPEVLRERAFVELASRCQAVICCRVTPKQKALIVALVKKYQQVVTLAIGDGANDVNMIKTADIGVGLAGQEGMQAVQNSDYVLAQFCFLRRLLLVHGRWSYMRICKFLRYFIYKTLASMMVQIWFAFYSGFTAQPLYEGWFLALFNLLYSTLPILYIGLFEQDVSAERSLQMPELYVAGQRDQLFNYGVFLQAVAHGTATSLVNFFVTLLVSQNLAGPSGLGDQQSFAVLVALSGLLSITVEVVLITKYWTVLSLLTVVLSLSAYGLLTYATQSYLLFRISPVTFPFLYADWNVLSRPSALLVVLLNVSINTLLPVAVRIIVQELSKARKKEEVALGEDILAVEPMPQLRRESSRRRSSYAFSHREGYASLITQGTSLRRAPGANPEVTYESVGEPQDEAPPEAPRTPKRMSLGDRRPSVEAAIPSPDLTLSLDEAPGPQQAWGPRTREPRTLSPRRRSQTPPVPEEAPVSLPQVLELAPESESQLPEEKEEEEERVEREQGLLDLGSSPWRIPLQFWRSWPHAWPRDAHPDREDAPPAASAARASLPAGFGEAPTAEQPMEVEPWPVEVEPSPMEWLPVPLPAEEQPRDPRPSPSDRGKESFPFSNKPGLA